MLLNRNAHIIVRMSCYKENKLKLPISNMQVIVRVMGAVNARKYQVGYKEVTDGTSIIDHVIFSSFHVRHV